MATITKAWSSGTGSVTLTYNGQGNGTIVVVSDDNNLNVRRSMNITIKTTDNTVSRSVTVIQEASDQGMYVDLGLPSGTLWAKGNIVSDGNGGYKIGQETDYGAYFSWGNSVPHFSASGTTFDDGYDFGTSSTGSPYKDTPGATIPFTTSSMDAAFSPLSINDAARQLLGGKWRVPTANEIQELVYNTDFQFTTINGVKGGKFMKKSDNSIYVFLPGTGFYDTSSHQMSWRVGLGDYWSSSLNGDDAVFYLYFQTPSTRQLSSTGQRFMARCIRPVRGDGVVPPQPSQDVYDFDYTGAVQSVTLQPGTYFLQVWGAMGGDCGSFSSASLTSQSGGKGGYSQGTLVLTSATTLYIYVGGKGQSYNSGGWNGGGSVPAYNSSECQYHRTNSSADTKYLATAGSGGGATDIRTVGGSWDNSSSLASRIIVAGGGSGGYANYYAKPKDGSGTVTRVMHAGYAGGGTSGLGYSSGTGGTQDRGNALGEGQSDAYVTSGTYHYGGGGGGYYGGYSGGGGSGYVDSQLSSASTNDGTTSFPSPSGGTETGHSGNGYVRITKTA